METSSTSTISTCAMLLTARENVVLLRRLWSFPFFVAKKFHLWFMMSARIKWSHITHKISSISQLVKFSKNTKRKETKSWNTSLRMTTNTLWSTKVLKTRIIHSWFSILTTSKRSQLIRVMEPQKLKFQDQRKTRSILKMRLPLSKFQKQNVITKTANLWRLYHHFQETRNSHFERWSLISDN